MKQPTKGGQKHMGTIPSTTDLKPGISRLAEYNVLIAPEDTEEVTRGGIIIATSIKDANDIATMRGRLVMVSPHAFNYAEWQDGDMPRPGDAVIFAKYAGTLVKGADGREYRLCKDKDVAAVLEE